MDQTRPVFLGQMASARAGDTRALGRLLTLVERSPSGLPELFEAAATSPGKAHRIGITGPPGAGKSTLTSAVVSLRRAEGERVAVLAVDPSSPFSGGALLGDRLRMLEHVADRGVYIRSMASRGHLGGLAVAAALAVEVLDAVGFDTVIIETVGVGQNEVEVARVADTTILVTAPGTGDEVQAVKAGIMEIADVLVLNKADHPASELAARQLRNALGLRANSARGDWAVPLLCTTATASSGVAELSAAVRAHGRWLAESGSAWRRRRDRAAKQILEIASGQVKELLEVPPELVTEVAERRMDPWSAARLVTSRLGAAAAPHSGAR